MGRVYELLTHNMFTTAEIFPKVYVLLNFLTSEKFLILVHSHMFTFVSIYCIMCYLSM